MFSRIDHSLSQKRSLNTFKIEIISSIFSIHNGLKLEINYEKKLEKHKHMDAKQYAINQAMDHWRNQVEITRYLETNENGNTVFQNLWDPSKAFFKREVYSDTGLP